MHSIGTVLGKGRVVVIIVIVVVVVNVTANVIVTIKD